MGSRTVLPLALFAAVMLIAVAARTLLPIDETRYLAVAWEMHLSGDPLHLTRNFEPYTHKPPLLFWIVNLIWLVTGVSEFAGRLVGPAAALGVVAGTAALAGRLWPAERGVGARAATVLAGFTVFAIYGSTTMFDALLAATVLLGIAALWRIGQGGAGRGAWLVLGLAMALGGLAKGPVILVHLLPPFLALPLWAPVPPRLGAALRGFGLAFAFGLGLVALWLVPALLTMDPEVRYELLWTQSAARVAGGLAHDRPVWFLAALLPVLLFPWGWSWRLWRGMAEGFLADPAARLCAIWALSGLVLFSLISGKQAHYLIPEFPAVALLFARALGRPGQGARGGSLAWLPVGLLGLAALGFALGLIPAAGDLAAFAPRWPVAAMGGLCLLLAAAVLRLGAGGAHLALGLGLTAALHLPVAATGLGARFDSHPVAQRLAEAAPGGLALLGLADHAQFSFAARLTQPIATPADAAALAAWAAAHPEGTVFGPVATAGIDAPPVATAPSYVGEIGFWPVAALSVPGSAPAD
jgi:4-amino-4-deoxy-L-arabinose transferase-like glycosyltransferase